MSLIFSGSAERQTDLSRLSNDRTKKTRIQTGLGESLSWRSGLNRRPAVYETAALPLSYSSDQLCIKISNSSTRINTALKKSIRRDLGDYGPSAMPQPPRSRRHNCRYPPGPARTHRHEPTQPWNRLPSIPEARHSQAFGSSLNSTGAVWILRVRMFNISTKTENAIAK